MLCRRIGSGKKNKLEENPGYWFKASFGLSSQF